MINPYQGEISLNRHVWLRRFGAVFALAGLVLVSGCEIRPLGQAPPAPPTTGIYKSENAGNTWIYLSPNKANLVIGDTSVFLADPKVPSVLYWTTPGLGVYRSWNSGNNWQRLNAGLAQQFASITDIVFAPSDTNTLFLVGNFDNIGRVVTGSNGGENWHSLYTELPSNSAITGIAVDYQNPKKLYAISTSRAFLISEDSGQTWKAVSWFTGDPVRILIHPQSPNMILVQETAGGLDLSTDQGLTWKSILPAGMTHAIYEIQFNPLINNSIFLASCGSVDVKSLKGPLACIKFITV